MKNRPLWFHIFSVVAFSIAVVNIFTHVAFLRIVTMICLAVVMASLGSFELKKNRKMAFALFGVAAFQVFVLAEMFYVTATK
ncbi:hypothetical protein HP567_013305 [Brevibacillus sp. M2.1A]|uniref:hypothetical protein n=1 Tax=Brevibacillus TaxID=55080 RepID=UPI00156B2AE2|nr:MULTISPECIES: hypothetical protein [Brevibacillus]MBY0088258.1 hypothetical protein [Brevibacillus brevis]MCC8435523.1 hypothetical protein [Brevibacillus sp. M2.1A]MCE0452047.1 hypothetical protein [Brevibacillus sp. AF8]MCM3141620.1 hypothetical protein [Brevibacillus sp. MER 51]UKK97770.1 hypothetical protein FO446_10240 [Brevibacillus brevis]